LQSLLKAFKASSNRFTELFNLIPDGLLFALLVGNLGKEKEVLRISLEVSTDSVEEHIDEVTHDGNTFFVDRLLFDFSGVFEGGGDDRDEQVEHHDQVEDSAQDK